VHLREEDGGQENSGDRDDGNCDRRVVVLNGGEVIDDRPGGEDGDDKDGGAGDPSSLVKVAFNFENRNAVKECQE